MGELGESQATPESIGVNKLLELIRKYASRVTLPYKETLKSDSEDLDSSELESRSRTFLDQHIYQLDLLNDLLEKVVVKGEPFEPVIQTVKMLEMRNEPPRQTFSVALAPQGKKIPETPNDPQFQIRLHSNISANDPETISEAYYALGLRLPPPEVIAKSFRQSTEQTVSVNTVGVYRDPYSKELHVMPQGGITFRWRRGDQLARTGGFVYVGTHPHILDLLRQGVVLRDFASMQSSIVKLSRYRSKIPLNFPTTKP